MKWYWYQIQQRVSQSFRPMKPKALNLCCFSSFWALITIRADEEFGVWADLKPCESWREKVAALKTTKCLIYVFWWMIMPYLISEPFVVNNSSSFAKAFHSKFYSKSKWAFPPWRKTSAHFLLYENSIYKDFKTWLKQFFHQSKYHQIVIRETKVISCYFSLLG